MFVIDTNAIIDLYVRYYCKDIFKQLNSDFSAIVSQNKIYLINQVVEELQVNLDKDSLKEFDQLNMHTLNETVPVQKTVGKITEHLFTHHKKKLVTSFSKGADIYLIAFAKVHNKTIITNERGTHNTNMKLYIPAVARQQGVKTIDLVSFFRHQGLKY